MFHDNEINRRCVLCVYILHWFSSFITVEAVEVLGKKVVDDMKNAEPHEGNVLDIGSMHQLRKTLVIFCLY